ncbi:hypothetical protein FHR47_002314 [Xanthomonas arboricola]|nr:hypothetical protein [Xanthomonas cannabis]
MSTPTPIITPPKKPKRVAPATPAADKPSPKPKR